MILYGSPGVGKTAAARLVLEEAKKSNVSPFGEAARFVEVDATTLRFDERGIADPLMGTVHDPIYQGAGPLGMAGIPQPKPGAVTKAHAGVLFIDEIGELYPVQMNKLLKVLEDRKVFLESAYYNSGDRNVPRLETRIPDKPQVGLVNGLAVYGPQRGALLEIEATIYLAEERKGSLIISGIVEEEEMERWAGNCAAKEQPVPRRKMYWLLFPPCCRKTCAVMIFT